MNSTCCYDGGVSLRHLSAQHLTHLLTDICSSNQAAVDSTSDNSTGGSYIPPRDLIIEDCIMKQIDKLCSMSMLKNCGISRVFRLSQFEDGNADASMKSSSNSHKIFMIRSLAKSLRCVLNCVKCLTSFNNVGNSSTCEVHVIFVPRLTKTLSDLIESEGLLNNPVRCREYMWQFLALDSNLLSYELPLFHASTFVDGVQSFLPCSARSLFAFQTLYGKISNRVGIGRRADAILNQLSVLEAAFQPSKSGKSSGNTGGQSANTFDMYSLSGQIDHLIVFDRDVDYISTLLSPVTYEALLNEVYDVKCGVLDLSHNESVESLTTSKICLVGHADFEDDTASNMNVPGSELQRRTELAQTFRKLKESCKSRIDLTAPDVVFENIRNRHFASIFAFLSENAKHVQRQQAKSAQMSVQQMRQFVEQNLSDLQRQSKSISMHIAISELIQEVKGHDYEELLPLESSLILSPTSSATYKECISFLHKSMSIFYPNVESILRFMILTSKVFNGLHSNDYQGLKKSFCECFGFKHIYILDRLRTLSLFNCKGDSELTSSSFSFATFADKMDLIPSHKVRQVSSQAAQSKIPEMMTSGSSQQSIPERHPSFVFNDIYTPVICRVISRLYSYYNNSSPVQPFSASATGVPQGISDTSQQGSVINNLVPGHHFSVNLNTVGSTYPSGGLSSKTKKKYDLVYFVGGVSYAEVAALKALEYFGIGNTSGKQYIVMADCILNSKSLATSLLNEDAF